MKIWKIVFTLGIVTGLAAVSAKAQESCDGPVLVPGYTVGSCDCKNSTLSCTPSSSTIGYRDDYYECGGIDYDWCSAYNETVGYVNPGCVDQSNIPLLATLQEAYDDCLIDAAHHNGPGTCPAPQFCDWNTCSMGTSGTPIITPVVEYLGDWTYCGEGA